MSFPKNPKILKYPMALLYYNQTHLSIIFYLAVDIFFATLKKLFFCDIIFLSASENNKKKSEL